MRRALAIAVATVMTFMTCSAWPAGTATGSARVDEGLKTITEDVRITDGPVVVVTPRGTALAVWVESNGRVMTSQRSAAAAQWSEPTVIARHGFYAVVSLRGRDRALVAWQTIGDASASVSVRSLDAEGEWSAIERVARWQRHGGVTVALTAASNARGDMLVAWTRGHRVRAAYREAGEQWQAQHTFPDSDAYSLLGVANVDPDGNADLLFPAASGGGLSSLRAYHRDSAGSWTGQTAATFATGVHYNGRTFDASISREGAITAAWMRRSGPAQPWKTFARFQPEGGAFEMRTLIAPDAENPAVAVTDSGSAAVTFHHEDESHLYTGYSQFTEGTGWTRAQYLQRVKTKHLTYGQLGIQSNGSGDVVVHTQGVHRSDQDTFVRDHRMISCSGLAVCGASKRLDRPRGYSDVDFGVRSAGGVDVVWGAGCATEECIRTSVRASRIVAFVP